MAAQIQEADEDDLVAAINIVPFVDVVLVLLVIFMLTSSTIVRASLRVDLPRAASAGGRVESTVNLTITRDGALLLNGQPVASPSSAGELIRREAQASRSLQAVIAADKGVAYGKVVELIDLVKSNGVAAFALDVERGPAPVETAAPAAPSQTGLRGSP